MVLIKQANQWGITLLSILLALTPDVPILINTLFSERFLPSPALCSSVYGFSYSSFVLVRKKVGGGGVVEGGVTKGKKTPKHIVRSCLQRQPLCGLQRSS